MNKLYYKYYSHYTERHGRLSAITSQYYRQKEFSLGSDINTLTVQYLDYNQKIQNETNPTEIMIQKKILKQIADEIINKFNDTLIHFPHRKETELNIISNLGSKYINNKINKLIQPQQEIIRTPIISTSNSQKGQTDYQPIPYLERQREKQIQRRELDSVHKESSSNFPYSQSPINIPKSSASPSRKLEQPLSQHRGSMAERMAFNQQQQGFLPKIN